MVPVNADTARAVYTMLREFPPFCRWSLPEADKLNFACEALTSRWADYDPNTKTLRVSTAKLSKFQSLLVAVAHEMCHVRQDFSGRWPAKNHHDAFFKEMTQQVCKSFDFDPANF